MNASEQKKLDKHITWLPNYCKHCYTCINACPVDNLKFEGDEMISLDQCTQCRLCEKYCPDFAIEVEPKTKKNKKKAEKSGKREKESK